MASTGSHKTEAGPQDDRQAASYQILMTNLVENSPNLSQGAVSVAADQTVKSGGNRPGGWKLEGLFMVLTNESSGARWLGIRGTFHGTNQ